MRAIPLRLWLLAVLSGVLQALPFPLSGPVPAWRRAICWLCLTPLLLALRRDERHGRKLRLVQLMAVGYASGVVWYLLNCYWIEGTMQRYGGLPETAAWGVLLLFALYLGLYHALFAGAVYVVQSRHSWRTTLTFIPFLWVAVEFARTQITGFPWDLLGYTQVDHLGLTRLAPIGGVMLLSLQVAAVNAWWAGAVTMGFTHKWAITTVLLVTLLLVASARWFAPPPDTATQQAILLQDNLNVGAVQSTDDQQPAETREQLLASLVDLSKQPATVQAGSNTSSLQVILWPEAPTDLFDNDREIRGLFTSLATQTHATVIAEDVAQAPADADGTRHLYNSARLTRPDGTDGGRYDKMHLVPFGEYTPYKPLFFFAGKLLDDLPFVPGLSRHALSSDGHRYGVFICYESIFGDEVRGLTDDGAQVLVNLSDDGWYGDSSAPWEHLDMARMRAIENDRWLLRSTNTGVTAVVDPHGRITARLPRHVRSSLAADFGFRDSRTLYARFGDWVGWMCAAVSIVVLAAGKFRRGPVH